MSKDIDALSQYMDAVEELVFGVRAELRELKEANQARLDADKAWDVGAAVAGVRTDFDAKITKHTEALDEVRAALAAALEEVKSIPAPEKGEPGKDGADADPEVVAALVAKAVAEIPPPKDGRDGSDGADGRSVSVFAGGKAPTNPNVGDLWIVD